MTGYDLAKGFESSVAFVWHAPDSQIYPELRKMAKEYSSRRRKSPGAPTAKRRSTASHRRQEAAFRQWMNTPLEYSRERDPVHLKAAYLEWAEPSAAREHMQAHIEYHTMRRAQWTEMIKGCAVATNVMLNKRLAATAESRTADAPWNTRSSPMRA